MRHGMPPFQQALNHGLLPSLSPDVETNMTTDPFSLMALSREPRATYVSTWLCASCGSSAAAPC